ncbi:MAG: hypothetical protein COB02_08450 [Candidatus Cloacimonadota bacterium]|nr:MAG: hypothetical protein COB02_08450 [Candidatus Cloacimonadota bacterium]
MKSYPFIYKDKQINFRFPVHRIALECNYNQAVILEHTRSESEKFARTPYWIQCPRLISAVHRIESKGWIKILESFVQGPYQEKWKQFTNEVPQILKNTLDEKYYLALEAENRLNVAGVQNPFHLKCLHSHYGFYLVHKKGFVGEFIHGMILWKMKREKSNPLGTYCEANFLECEEEND